MTTRQVWVVGSSGLLGSALSRRHDPESLFIADPIPWTSPAAATVLTANLRSFAAQVDCDLPWVVYWAAGAGVIGSGPETFARESAVLSDFVQALRASSLPRHGAFFFASSASVYAGSSSPPFSESTPSAPLNAYAQAKLVQELLIGEALSGRLPHVLGRISTLFGPGQDLSKNQGLVSKMCLQAAKRQPVSVFVPIDTLRDYIFVDDAAEVIRRFVAVAQQDAACSTRTRVVARGSSLTIAELAARIRGVGHRRIGFYQAAVAPGSAHIRDLRVRTEYEAELRGMSWTPTPVGIHVVYSDIVDQLVRSGPV